jgi:hypothetical protein
MENSIKKIYGNSNTKGTKRQNDINSEVVEFFSKQDSYKDKIFKKEVKLKTPNSLGGKPTFKVDIAVYDVDGSIVEVILNKAPYSNMKQNETNAIGSRVNEVFRLIYDFPNVKLTWFTFSPNNTPYFKKSGLVKNIEKNDIHSICNENFYNRLRIDESEKFSIREIFVTFDWKGISVGQDKKDYDQMFINGQFSFENIKIQEFTK